MASKAASEKQGSASAYNSHGSKSQNIDKLSFTRLRVIQDPMNDVL